MHELVVAESLVQYIDQRPYILFTKVPAYVSHAIFVNHPVEDAMLEHPIIMPRTS